MNILRSSLATVLLLPCLAAGQVAGGGVPMTDVPAFRTDARVLFQGDSITDGNRGRGPDPNHIHGHGYVYLIAADFGARFPDRRLTFVNRGISGNKVSDLAKRWKADAVDVRPDVLSILIGVNDLNGGVPAEQYEQAYDKLLEETITALPGVRPVLCEPFGLPTGKKKDGWEQYGAELARRQAVVARLAAKHNAALVRLQRAFDNAARRAPAEYWIWDGVHPTTAGNRVIADEWVRTVAAHWPTDENTKAPAPQH